MSVLQRQQGGFTLVELMAASVITAFLALVAVGGMISVTSARGSLDEATEVMDELRYAADLLRQDLANVHRDRQEMLFEGLLEVSDPAARPRLRFRALSTRNARPNQPESDVYEIEYLFIESHDGTLYLSRRICPVVGIEQDREHTAGGILTKLSEHISYFNVRYFDGAGWSEIWPVEQQLLPTLIEVSLAARVVQDGGRENIYAKQVIATFSRLGDQRLDDDEVDFEIEFTDPESAAGR